MLINYKITTLLFILSISIMAFGCNSNSSDEPDQVFEAQLSSLNDSNDGIPSATADAELTVNGDQLTIRITANGVEPGMIHPQHIHASGTCPTASADSNDDGYVDVIEGVPSYGAIFIPLDDDVTNLSAQTSFPTPDGSEYVYTQTVSMSALEAEAGEDINLSGRHIVIHGISNDINLPSSVQTLGDTPPNVTLPIACGALVEVN